MARLCDPIVSPALSGKSLEIGVGVVKDIQTNQASANAEVAALRSQVDTLLALIQSGTVAVPTAPVVEAVETAKTTTKGKAAE